MSTNRTPNILFSTTRMWNCGDDFILFGVQNLLRGLVPEFNSVVYNRNPELHQFRTFRRHLNLKVETTSGPLQLDLADILKDQCGQFDNSWRTSHGLAAMDYCIFAGTPEWFGPPVDPLTEQLAASKIPIAYLGIGIFERSKPLSFSQLPEKDAALIRRASVVTVRDADCATMLDPVRPVRLPCPALLSAPHGKQRREKRRLALSTQGANPGNGQAVDAATLDYSMKLFRALAAVYDCTLVCHYIDELTFFAPLLGDVMPFAYSYDARDYIAIYDRFDMCVTTRVHGAGLCASLGIPSVVLGHSARSDTAMGFLSDVIDIARIPPEEVVEKIGAMAVAERSQALLEHKSSTYARYLDLLGPHMKHLG